MDRSAVKAIVEKNLDPLCRSFGIAHWKIAVSYQPEAADENGITEAGNCSRLVDYNKAGITLNPEAFETEEEVLWTLRHELFHIVAAPFDIFLNAVKRATEDDEKSLAILKSVWTHAMEKCVINLERMYHGMTNRGQAMPEKKVGKGYENVSPKTGKALSKKPLTKAKADAQRGAIFANKAKRGK